MRLFFALPLPLEAQEAIRALQQQIQEIGSGRFPPPENLHLTLAFLGEIPASSLPVLEQILEELSFSPFSLKFCHLDRFSQPSGDLWWVGPQESQALRTLHQRLNQALEQEGFPRERRPFRPHITLGRNIRLNNPGTQPAWQGSPLVLPVEKLCLFASVLGQSGPRYSCLYQKEGDSGAK